MTTSQQRLNEIEAQEKALADEKAKLLAESKVADLEMVKKLCKQHGFTATQLRGSLATKGKKKAAGDTATTKPAAKKTAAKKSACLRRFNADHVCRLILDQGLLLD